MGEVGLAVGVGVMGWVGSRSKSDGMGGSRSRNDWKGWEA